MPIPELPYDLWAHIASFLPTNALLQLYSVNRAFLDLALNEKYRNVEFLNPPGCQSAVNWVRRLRDPFVAERVKTFCLCPTWFREVTYECRPLICIYPAHVQSVRQASWPSPPTTGPGNGKRTGERSSRRRQHARYRSYPPHYHASGSSTTDDYQQSSVVILQEILGQMTKDAISGFRNVYNFTIISASRGWSSNTSTPSLAPFLDRSWRAFGADLRQLTINVPLGDWEALFSSSQCHSEIESHDFLPSLEELTIRFAPEMTITNANHETSILSTLVAPFVTRFTSHLRKINFISSAIGDHSGLFNSLALHYFTKLDSLVLNIAFYPPILSDPSGLMLFLRNHSRILQDVRMLPTESYRLPFGVYLRSAPDATIHHAWPHSAIPLAPTSSPPLLSNSLPLDFAAPSVVDHPKKMPYTTFSNWLTQQTFSYPEILHDLHTLVVAPPVQTLFQRPLMSNQSHASSSWYAGRGVRGCTSARDELSFPVQLVERSKNTLVHLVLMDRELSFKEVNLIAETVAHRRPITDGYRTPNCGSRTPQWLKVLRIRVSALSPQVFDLLAKALVGLRELEIKFSGLVLDESESGDSALHAELDGGGQEAIIIGDDTFPILQEISPNSFMAQMQSRFYPHWHLRYLRLTPTCLVTTMFESLMMNQMKVCIPSLQYRRHIEDPSQR